MGVRLGPGNDADEDGTRRHHLTVRYACRRVATMAVRRLVAAASTSGYPPLSGTAGWQGRVVRPVNEAGEWIVVEEWLPAEYLEPI